MINCFSELLKKKFGTKYDNKVYELFAKARTYMRIKNLNSELLTTKSVTHSNKQSGQFQC